MQFIKGGFSFRANSKLDVRMRSFNESQIMSAAGTGLDGCGVSIQFGGM
jgi:hypothetical protein